MAEFMKRYATEQQCEGALIASRWPTGFVCKCACALASQFRREGRLYRQCIACRHQSSITSGTIFGSSKLGLTRWFLAMHLLTQTKNNVSSLELMRHLGVCYKTAWLVKHKVMEVMRLREDTRQLTGRVEIDDACLGGERTGGKRGRGSENKGSFMAAVQTTDAGQPVLICLSKHVFTKESMLEFAAKSLALPLTMISDGLGCFTAVADRTSLAGAKRWICLPTARSRAQASVPPCRRLADLAKGTTTAKLNIISRPVVGSGMALR
jgi:hypothetical protein